MRRSGCLAARILGAGPVVINNFWRKAVVEPLAQPEWAVEAIQVHKAAPQMARMFGVHPAQVAGWKKQALAGLPDILGKWP